MTKLCLVFVAVLSPAWLLALQHPFYQIGKSDYVYEVSPETTLEDLRHTSKPTIIQFAADWNTASVRFWPYLYTLSQLRPHDYEIVVIDLDRGWADAAQFQRELKTQFSNLPYMIILSSEAAESDEMVIHHGESGPSLNEYILPKIFETNERFMYKFIPAVEANWDNTFLPALQIYLDAYERAEDSGKNAADARRIATSIVLQQIKR